MSIAAIVELQEFTSAQLGKILIHNYFITEEDQVTSRNAGMGSLLINKI